MSHYKNKELNIVSIKNNLEKNGWHLLKTYFNKESIETIKVWIEKILNGGDISGYEPQYEDSTIGIKKLRRLYWNDPIFWENIFITQDLFKTVKLISNISKVGLVFHALFLKSKKTGGPVWFHQDQALWDYQYPNSLALWVALEKTDLRNGCIEVIDGSHKFGIIKHEKNSKQESYIPEEQLKGYGDRIPIEMEAGDILIWDRNTIHGSSANFSDRNRKGMVMVFVETNDGDFKAYDLVDANYEIRVKK